WVRPGAGGAVLDEQGGTVRSLGECRTSSEPEREDYQQRREPGRGVQVTLQGVIEVVPAGHALVGMRGGIAHGRLLLRDGCHDTGAIISLWCEDIRQARHDGLGRLQSKRGQGLSADGTMVATDSMRVAMGGTSGTCSTMTMA